MLEGVLWNFCEPKQLCVEQLQSSTSFLSVKTSGYSSLDENREYLRAFGSRSYLSS